MPRLRLRRRRPEDDSRQRGRLSRGARRLGTTLWRLPPDAWMGIVTAIALAVAWPTIWVSHDVPDSLLPLLAVMEVGPLLMLRRWPFYAWAVAAGGSVVWWLVVPATGGFVMPWPVIQFLVLLLTILVTAMLAGPVEIGATVFATGALFLVAMPDDLIGWAFGQVLIVVFGLLIRWLVLSRRQLAEETGNVEAERAQRAVLEERSRIARELHDVVAHHMSMVVVQAQSAPVRLADVPDEVRDELASIEASARQALNDVRGVLGVLRQQGGSSTATPQPGLEQMPDLLEGTRSAGVDVSWQLDLAAEACPEGTALVLYRVLQESLSNATRHAPGATISVTLDGSESEATLIVRNGPATASGESATASGEPAVRSESGGVGIPGMRARVEAVGGHMTAQGDARAGFGVEVVVPLQGRPQVGA